METIRAATSSPKADKYILRFERPGHRAQLKGTAALQKRSLNKHLLVLIEAGEKALASSGGAQ